MGDDEAVFAMFTPCLFRFSSFHFSTKIAERRHAAKRAGYSANVAQSSTWRCRVARGVTVPKLQEKTPREREYPRALHLNRECRLGLGSAPKPQNRVTCSLQAPGLG